MSGDRRRRVLRDEAQGSAASPARKAKAAGQRYTEQAKHAQLPRLIDLVPKRPLWICCWFILGAASIGLLYAADYADQRYLRDNAAMQTASLQLTGYATLASWWSTACLLSCAFLSATIYTIRCHRVDDYRGRYRQWGSLSFACLVGSAFLAAPIHKALQAAAVQATGYDWAGHPALWWMLPASFLGVIVGLRALLDMRPCKSGPFFLTLTVAAYVGSALGHLGIIQFEQVPTEVWLPLTFLAGHYCLFWALCLFARYVYLDAQGQLKTKRKKPRKTAKQADDDADLTATENRRSKKKMKRRATTTADDDEASADEAAGEEDESDSAASDDEMSLAEMELLTNPDLTRRNGGNSARRPSATVEPRSSNGALTQPGPISAHKMEPDSLNWGPFDFTLRHCPRSSRCRKHSSVAH